MGNHNAPYVAASDTSRARAYREDSNGTTKTRKDTITALLETPAVYGATWAELAKSTGYHHGQVSGALSKLHEYGDVFQLKTTRNGCHPYVLRKYRDQFTDDQVNDEPVKTRANQRVAALEAIAEAAHQLAYGQSKDAAQKWTTLKTCLKELKDLEQ